MGHGHDHGAPSLAAATRGRVLQAGPEGGESEGEAQRRERLEQEEQAALARYAPGPGAEGV